MKKRKLLVGILTSSMTLTAVTGAVCAEDVPLGELFPDEAFRSYCETFDTDGDGCLSTDEAEQVTSITIEEDLGIGSLEGVGIFANLTELTVRDNEITEIDLSGLDSLTKLCVTGNLITEIDISEAPLLADNYDSMYLNELDHGHTLKYSLWSDYVIETDRGVAIQGAFGRPTAISMSDVTSSSILVSWAPVEGATGYEVWRSRSPSENFVCIYAGEETYKNSICLNADTTYYYKVRAVREVDGEEECSEFSYVESANTYVAPSITDVTIRPGGYVNIYWTPCSYADGYQMVVLNPGSSSYKNYATTRGTMLPVYLEDPGVPYYFKVRGYVIGNGTTFGAYTKPIKLFLPEQTSNLRITGSTSNSISLEWDEDPEDGVLYEVWRRTEGFDDYVLLGRYADPSKVSTCLTAGTTYYYKVRSYYYFYDGNDNIHRIYGDYTPILTGVPQ